MRCGFANLRRRVSRLDRRAKEILNRHRERLLRRLRAVIFRQLRNVARQTRQVAALLDLAHLKREDLRDDLPQLEERPVFIQRRDVALAALVDVLAAAQTTRYSDAKSRCL